MQRAEDAIPAIMAMPAIQVSDLPAMAAARHEAASAMRYHQQMRDIIDKYHRQTKTVRGALRLLQALSRAFKADRHGPVPEDDDAASDEDLERLAQVYDAAIEFVDGCYILVAPHIQNMALSISKIAKLLKNVADARTRMVGTDAMNSINSIAGWIEAMGELSLALRIIRSHIQTELTGIGVPVRSRADLDRFLSDAWT